MQLEERPTQLLNQLVSLKKASMPQLMEHTNLTKRQIVYDLDKVNYWLVNRNLPSIKYKRMQVIELPNEVTEYISTCKRENKTGNFIFSEEEREIAIYLFLFIRNEVISTAHLTSLLKVSKNTVISDVKKTNELIRPYLVQIAYTRQNGYHLKGTELDKRVLLMNLLMKTTKKPSGISMIRYCLDHAGVILEEYDIRQLLNHIGEKYDLRFVEERQQDFIYFLYFYHLRRKQGKLVCLHKPELTALLQDEMKPVAEELLALLGLDQADSETAFLVIQFLGLSLGNTDMNCFSADLLFKICERLVNEFEIRTCIPIKEKYKVASTLYQHLKPAYFRMKYRVPIANPMLAQIEQEHKDLYEIVKDLLEPVAMLLNITIPPEEIGFITIHFGAMVEEPKQAPSLKKKAIIVCPGGVSSSLMVKHQLQLLFPEISTESVMSLNDFRLASLEGFDLVFSTVPVETKLPSFIVRPIMSPLEKSSLVSKVHEQLFGIRHDSVPTNQFLKLIEEYADIFDREGLEDALLAFSLQKKKEVHRRDKPMLNELLTKETIQFVDRLTEWEEAIKLAAEPLLSKGAIKESYVEAMIDTVKTLGPYIIIGPEIAIPHARPECGVNEIGMSFLKLEEPVYFLEDEKNPVSFIFCIAAVDNKTHLKALSQLTKILSNKESVQRLRELHSVEEMLELIDQHSEVYA